MSHITISGGQPLRGEVAVQCAKNSVLPILAAAFLSGDVCRIVHCPPLSDVEAAADILRHLGCRVAWDGEDLLVDATGQVRCHIPEGLMRKMRSSVIFLGAILSRCGEASLSYPGGCELGPRPIDLHLSALRTLGAEIDEVGGELRCRAATLRGGDILLSLPSVGATENAMLAACGAEGVTVISNAAREPEIVDLQYFLQKIGADVQGAGSSTIVIRGGGTLHGCRHRCIGDRIAAATYLCAAAGAGGTVTVRRVSYRHLSPVTLALQQAGCTVEATEDAITLHSTGRLRSVPPIRTAPYPGFPTDAQSPLMAALLRAEGTTMFVENMFQNRYRHVPELVRMGADIRLEGRVAVVCGVETLQGASLHATDLRGGAAMLIAALQAQGICHIYNTHHLYRGYAHILADLHALGATAAEVEDTQEVSAAWQREKNITAAVGRADSPCSTSC